MDEQGTSPGGVTRRRLIGAAALTAATTALPARAQAATKPKASAAQSAHRGRRRRRRRARRPHRRARRSSPPAARSSCSRRATASAGACSTSTSATASSPRAAPSSSAPPRTASPRWPRTSGVDTFPTYNTGDNIYFRNGTATRYSSSGPLGPVPPDPHGRRRGRAGDPRSSTTWPRRSRSTRRGRRRTPRSGTRRRFETWKLANVADALGPLPARRRHRPRLLVRAARRLAALRPLLPRRGRQRVQPGHHRADWSTPAAARRSAASSAARSSCPIRLAAALGRPRRPQPARAPDRQRERHGDRDRRRLQRDRPSAPSSPCRRRWRRASTTSPQLPALRDQLTQRMPMGT